LPFEPVVNSYLSPVPNLLKDFGIELSNEIRKYRIASQASYLVRKEEGNPSATGGIFIIIVAPSFIEGGVRLRRCEKIPQQELE
jgi:hypothetical protein